MKNNIFLKRGIIGLGKSVGIGWSVSLMVTLILISTRVRWQTAIFIPAL